MVWKNQKSREAMLDTLKRKLELREQFLLASGLPKERNCYDPVLRHILADSRKIRRSIASHVKAQESAAERAEKLAKANEGKPSRPGKEPKAPKAPKEPKAATAPEASTPAEVSTPPEAV